MSKSNSKRRNVYTVGGAAVGAAAGKLFDRVAIFGKHLPGTGGSASVVLGTVGAGVGRLTAWETQSADSPDQHNRDQYEAIRRGWPPEQIQMYARLARYTPTLAKMVQDTMCQAEINIEERRKRETIK